MTQDYDYVAYRPEYLDQVVELLGLLWRKSPEINRSHFIWKHHDNPQVEYPLGVVARHQGRVVGYRGFFASSWHIPAQGHPFKILCPGDTCVAPEHRMKGLSIGMADWATAEYAGRYRFFLNMSATRNSVPGYLKLGYHPLADKTFMARSRRLGALANKSRVLKKILKKVKGDPVQLGRFGDILVSKLPQAEEMARVADIFNRGSHRICLLQDQPYFEWRFGGHFNRYLFYYHHRDHELSGYVVMMVDPAKGSGSIVDYADSDGQSLRKLIEFIIRRRHFYSMTVYDAGLDSRLKDILVALKFDSDSHAQRAEKAAHGVWPVFIRPVKDRPGPEDWAVHDLDVRHIDNWQFKQVCNDGI